MRQKHQDAEAAPRPLALIAAELPAAVAQLNALLREAARQNAIVKLQLTESDLIDSDERLLSIQYRGVYSRVEALRST
jgi:hypothetical protein